MEPEDDSSASSEPVATARSSENGPFGPITVTVTSSLALRAESLALSRSTYVPGTVNDAVVDRAAGSAKVTEPGPLTADHVCVVEAGGLGRPSSVTVPFRVALAGSTMDWSAPAFTRGGWFPSGGQLTDISSSLPSFSFGSLLLSTPRSTMYMFVCAGLAEPGARVIPA